jgi:hypothetical protein
MGQLDIEMDRDGGLAYILVRPELANDALITVQLRMKLEDGQDVVLDLDARGRLIGLEVPIEMVEGRMGS